MKKLWKTDKNIILFIVKVFTTWRLFLFFIEILSGIIPLNRGYLGSLPWANFDGVHYLHIAQYGYQTYEQAFFPLFPFLIKSLSILFINNYLISSLFIVHASLLIALLFFYKLLAFDFEDKIVKWFIALFLFFPTSFFFVSIYTESLFLMFVILSFYLARKKNFILASVIAGFASATKLVGIFLLPALILEFYLQNKDRIYLKFYILNLISIIVLSSSGLVAYIFYLWKVYGDPLLFIHSLPAFGVGRSGGEVIFLPQVIFRYLKIFITVPFFNHDFPIALLEFNLFSMFLFILILNIKKIRLSYLIFSIFAIMTPTLSGTLSSIPRYLLVVFPVFVIFAQYKYKKALLGLFIIFLIILTAFFLRGYFIA